MKARAAILLWLLAGVAGAQTTIRPGGSSGGGVTPATLNDATYCPDVGASDAYVCSMVSAPSSYAAGMLVTLSANTANTGTASVNVDSLGVKTITRSDGSTLVTGDITATSPVLLEYDGTNFRMLSQWMRGSTGSGSFVLNTSPTIEGLTFGNTNKATIGGNYITMGSSDYGLAVNTTGGITEATISWSSTLSPDAPILASGGTSNSWHFAERADYTYDFQNPCLTGLGTAACTDPTLILHSATQATNQAMSLGHNRTQGVVTANGGVLARSLTYASGSDPGLTVQGSLTGNWVNLKNSGNTLVGSFSLSSSTLKLGTEPGYSLRLGAAADAAGYLEFNNGSGYTYLNGFQNQRTYQMNYGANSTSAINSAHVFTLDLGASSAGFGNGIALRGQSSTTASQDMVRLSGVWTTATHASRSAAMVFDTVNNAGSLAEVGRWNADGGLKIATGTKPTCASGIRGTIYYVAGGAGVLDTLEVCRKDAADAYAWVTLF